MTLQVKLKTGNIDSDDRHKLSFHYTKQKEATDGLTFLTHQLTSMAALFSAMNGSSPQTLQKPSSKIHHNLILAGLGESHPRSEAVRSGATEQDSRPIVPLEQVPLALRTCCSSPLYRRDLRSPPVPVSPPPLQSSVHLLVISADPGLF